MLRDVPEMHRDNIPRKKQRGRPRAVGQPKDNLFQQKRQKDAGAVRIVIIAPGSRGDVQPYIAFGKELQNAGHSIVLSVIAISNYWLSRMALNFGRLGTI